MSKPKVLKEIEDIKSVNTQQDTEMDKLENLVVTTNILVEAVVTE